HGMAPMTNQQISALAQTGGQIEPRNAPAGTAPVGAIPADNDRRPIKLLEHARSHDPHHADMPGRLPFDDYEIGRGIELRAHRGDGFLRDFSFYSLTLTISVVQFLRDRFRDSGI